MKNTNNGERGDGAEVCQGVVSPHPLPISLRRGEEAKAEMELQLVMVFLWLPVAGSSKDYKSFDRSSGLQIPNSKEEHQQRRKGETELKFVKE